MGVATGDATQSTKFVVPREVPDGNADICVIANGIASDCIPVEVGPELREPRELYREAYQLIGSLADGPLTVLGLHGPRPVPPYGPGIDKELFRDRALQAYEHILLGLLSLGALVRAQEERQYWNIDGGMEKRLMAMRQIEYGLGMLCKLGDQLENSLDDKNFPNLK